MMMTMMIAMNVVKAATVTTMTMIKSAN